MERLYRGRLAPSPTGALHLGNIRTFMVAWLEARSRGGELVLRMEDLDHPKVKAGTARELLRDLRWLGFDWDAGPDTGGPHAPYTQSERVEYYHEALRRLQMRSLVYPCICSRRDVESGQSAPHAGEVLYYPGTCRGRFSDYATAMAQLPPQRLPAWRFRVEPSTCLSFTDHFAGRYTQDVAELSGDFVLARDAQGAGYMLAVVVDDALMGINHVVRGDDLLDATPRQLLLYRALGWQAPDYTHLPLVVSAAGRRLAKRHGDTRIATLRAQGIAPEQIIGVLAWWSGWGAWGERLSLSELLPRFKLESLPRHPAVLCERVKRYLRIREGGG